MFVPEFFSKIAQKASNRYNTTQKNVYDVFFFSMCELTLPEVPSGLFASRWVNEKIKMQKKKQKQNRKSNNEKEIKFQKLKLFFEFQKKKIKK